MSYRDETWPAALYNHQKWQLIGKSQWCCSATAAVQCARANVQLDPRQQLANTPPLQSTTPSLHPVSIHQMAPPDLTFDCSLLLIYRRQKDERLSWPSWLTCSRRFTHITGHPSDAGQVQNRESSPATDQRSTTVPRHQREPEVPEAFCFGAVRASMTIF